MPLPNQTIGRLLVGIPLGALAILAFIMLALFTSRTPVPAQFFGCWRSDSSLLAIEPPVNLTHYRHVLSSTDHVGGWIQHIDSAQITVRILLLPVRYSIQRAPWKDSTGDHLVLDSVTYVRESFLTGDSTCTTS